jgi:hypothetical protein
MQNTSKECLMNQIFNPMCWIQGILLFDFTLVHVPAIKFKGPDALSRRPFGENEEIIPEEDSWLDDIALFNHISHPYHPVSLPSVLASTISQEENLKNIFKFLTTLEAPHFARTSQRKKFVQWATQF